MKRKKASFLLFSSVFTTKRVVYASLTVFVYFHLYSYNDK